MAVKKKKGKLALRRHKKYKKRYELKKSDITKSKLEGRFATFLKSLGLTYEEQFKLGYKFYDFRIRNTKIIIEVDGDFWHCNPEKYPDGPINSIQKKAKRNDAYKTALAVINGYIIIRIWENDFNNDKSKVKKIILESVQEYKKQNDK